MKTLNEIEKKQISELQQAIWDLEKARDHVAYAVGNSQIGRVILGEIEATIGAVQEQMDRISE